MSLLATLRTASRRRIITATPSCKTRGFSQVPLLLESRCTTSTIPQLKNTSQLVRRRVVEPRRYLSTEQREVLQKVVNESPVVLFMKGTPEQPMCGFSRAAIQILDLQQVPVEKMKTYNVLESDELRQNIKEFSEWPTVPQLYVNGEFIGGCDILLGMHQSGELETLLEDQGIIPKVEAAAA